MITAIWRRSIVGLIAVLILGGSNLAVAEPIRSGFNLANLPAMDDASSTAINLGFTVDLYGKSYNQVYVNENGNISFTNPIAAFTPIPLANSTTPIIAPFFADVDLSLAGDLSYGVGTIDGHNAFAATWSKVAHYSTSDDANLRNDFQVVLIDRSDEHAGDFDIEFNYGIIEWESGDFSGGVGGLAGDTARVGISGGDAIALHSHEAAGSGLAGALLSGGQNDLSQTRSTWLIENGQLVSNRHEIDDPDPIDFPDEPTPGTGTLPEPATWSMLALGLMAVGRMRKLSRGESHNRRLLLAERG